MRGATKPFFFSMKTKLLRKIRKRFDYYSSEHAYIIYDKVKKYS